MTRSNPTNQTLVDIVLSVSKKVIATGLAAVTPFVPFLAGGCVSEEAAFYSNFPAPKRRVTRTYEVHSEAPTASRLYDLIGFGEEAVGRKRVIGGRQPVITLKRNCGRKDHGPNCITRSLHHLPPGYTRSGIRATINPNDRHMHFILPGDNTSCVEMWYNEFENTLVTARYPVENGRVKQPLPEGFTTISGSMPLKWEDVRQLDRFFRSHFNNRRREDDPRFSYASLFTEDDLFEADYQIDSRYTLGVFSSCIDRINKKNSEGEYEQKFTERVGALRTAAERYRRINERDRETDRGNLYWTTMENEREKKLFLWQIKGKVKSKLITLYHELDGEAGKVVYGHSLRWSRDQLGHVARILNIDATR